MPLALALDRFLPYRLALAAGLVSEAVAAAYAPYGLSTAEWRVIAHVADRPGLTQQEIATLSRMDKVMVSRATIALEGRGLVARTTDPGDRRSRRLALTPAGRALFTRIAPAALAIEAEVAAALSTAERAQLLAMLARLEAAALAASGEPGRAAA